MSVEPPSSGSPTGPPSGPLSGPSQPGATQPGATTPSADRPTGPPGGPPGDGGQGGGSGGGSGGGPGGPSGPGGPDGGATGPGEGPGEKPERPWWKSAPRVAVIAAAIVAAVVLTVVLTRPDGTSDTAGEVLLQPAAEKGPDPFTESTAREDGTPPSPTALPSSSASANVTRGVDGSAPGLYGGTRKVSSCDVEKQVSVLQKDAAKNKAFASVQGIDPSAVPAYLRSLTPVQLRVDTRVTNHGYRDGAPTAYQAVLQAGTAVLVDDRGVPRVRCACGNPLTPPVAQKAPKQTGDAWPGYRSSNVVVVAPAVQVVNVFVIFDPHSGEWFERDKGDTGAGDEKTTPPVDKPTPTASVSLSPSESESGSPKPCVSAPADGTGPSPGGSPCPSTSAPSSAPVTPPSSSAAPQPPSSELEQPPASDVSQPQSVLETSVPETGGDS
ncbi:DUF6777 domain-containing protein [Streptomyces sp. NPDC059037]|uniref:DUF6777 domain-containing protein n=1 Tax=Streptomyces sp. NPDC059037 TaxID=3346710 RepID=UPI0036806505